MADKTLPPCPRADCDASPEDAPHHFHDWLGDTLTHQGRNSACITGGPGLSSRCYSAHVPNVSESPTGSPVADEPTPVVPDLVAALRASIETAREWRLAKEDLESLLAERDELRKELDGYTKPQPCDLHYTQPYDFEWCDAHDRTFPLGETCDHAGLSELEYLEDIGTAQRGRAIRAEMERDALRARLDAVLAAASDAARDIGNDTGSDVECYGDDYWRGMVMAASRILGDVRRAAEGVE